MKDANKSIEDVIKETVLIMFDLQQEALDRESPDADEVNYVTGRLHQAIAFAGLTGMDVWQYINENRKGNDAD